LSLLWERNTFFLFSSFKKQKLAAYHRVITMIYSIVIVIICTSCKKLSYRFLILGIAIILWDLFITLTFPYRCMSSNLTNIVLWIGLTPNILLLYLRTTSIRSALIIRDSDFGGLLMSYNLFVILSVFMFLLLLLVFRSTWYYT